MIEVSHLTKRYGAHTAVADLSFTVESGQIYGLLGPNGAGKSTTMNIITGCLASTEGTVRIGGFDIFEQPREAKSLIGYLPEQPPVYLDMTPLEYLNFVGRAKGVKKAELAEQVRSAMEVTQIAEMQNRLIRNLSKGYRQRVGIAQALLGQPEVIILDEPTVGLDPLQIIEIRDLIRELGRNHTVILSSHILSEVRAICHKVLIIAKGKLVACDTPEALEKLFATGATLSLTVKGDRAAIEGVLTPLELKSFTVQPEQDGLCAVDMEALEGTADALAERVFFAFCDAKLPILRMQSAQPSLEDVFIELTSHTPTGPAPGGEAETDDSPAEETDEKEADAQ